MSSVDERNSLFQRTRVLRKADNERRFLNLFLEQIFLVQKQYNRRVSEPLVIADRVE